MASVVCSQKLHFIESYLRESDPGFKNLCAEDQLTLKEALHIEVNRWAELDPTQVNSWKIIFGGNHTHLFLNIGSLWRPTSFGACGPSSRPDSPPSSLATWWVWKYPFPTFYVFPLEWEKRGWKPRLVKVGLVWNKDETRWFKRRRGALGSVSDGNVNNNLSESPPICQRWLLVSCLWLRWRRRLCLGSCRNMLRLDLTPTSSKRRSGPSNALMRLDGRARSAQRAGRWKGKLMKMTLFHALVTHRKKKKNLLAGVTADATGAETGSCWGSTPR